MGRIPEGLADKGPEPNKAEVTPLGFRDCRDHLGSTITSTPSSFGRVLVAQGFPGGLSPPPGSGGPAGGRLQAPRC